MRYSSLFSTVKSRNYESRNNDMYDRIIDDSVMEFSIGKSRYNDRSRYYDGFSADQGLTNLVLGMAYHKSRAPYK